MKLLNKVVNRINKFNNLKLILYQKQADLTLIFKRKYNKVKIMIQWILNC